jgi:RNA polymerase sigma-70 factor (ECF subfamily)
LHPERQTAEQITNGVPGAFEAYVDCYGPRLHRLARQYAANSADAEDLTQEIFVALYSSMAGFRGESSLSTWSYRIALNHCLKHANQKQPVTVSYGCAREEAECEERGPVKQAARRELTRQVQTALGGLSEDHQAVVLLHEMHEMTYAECAAVLQVPVGTVKSRLSYAFRRLRISLQSYVQSDDALPEAKL